jgi:hypothetical protein
MTHITAALELSRFAMCLCVVCVFVCFSDKEMPDAAKLRAHKAMPSPTCCYCGTRIKEARRMREATEEQLANAVRYRTSRGQQQLLHARHVCEAHSRHPPALPAFESVRNTMPHSLTACKRASSDGAHHLVLCVWSNVFLRAYRCVQQLQQSRHDAR